MKFTVTMFTSREFLHETIYLGMFYYEFQVHLCNDHGYNRDSNGGIVLEFYVERKTVVMLTKFKGKMLQLHFKNQVWLYMSTYKILRILSISHGNEPLYQSSSYAANHTCAYLDNDDSNHGNKVHMNTWDKFHSFFYMQSALDGKQLECIYRSTEEFQWIPLSISTVLAQFV